jgi:hypothetical protein
MANILSVALFSMGIFVALVRGVQGIRHFGWNSWRGLLFWMWTLAALFGTYEISYSIQTRLQQMVGGALGLAIGLAGGGILLVAWKPQWPPKSNTARTPQQIRS